MARNVEQLTRDIKLFKMQHSRTFTQENVSSSGKYQDNGEDTTTLKQL